VVEVFEGEVGHDGPLLVGELLRHGVDVRVVCPPAVSALFAGTAVTPLAVGTGVAALAALRRVLAEADVAHAHGLRAGLAVTLARASGLPFVLSWTDPVATTGAAGIVGRALTRTVVPAAAAVLAATPDLVRAATRLGAKEVALAPLLLPAAAVPSHTAEQVREELALPAEGPIVLAQARLVEESRLDVLVEACARWRRPGGPLVVLVGVGPAYRDLVGQATRTRAPVTFAGDRTDAPPPDPSGDGPDRTAAAAGPADQAEDGPVPEERASLADLLAAATLVVVTDPRARPGFALQAARAGVPLVVPHGGLIARLIGGETVEETAGQAGSAAGEQTGGPDAVPAGPPRGIVTVPAGDVDALDAAVRALLDDPVARADLAAAARASVGGGPDAAATASDLAARYERVSGDTATRM
jgi:glycosyltransferase involved in cell wall biosynthesis